MRTTTSPGRPAADQRALRQRELAHRPRWLATIRLQPLETSLVLVHLAELAVAAITLDQLSFALDLVLLRRRLLGRSSVSLVALAAVGRVITAERRQATVA
jgi:hypothetical protein